jgi:hypothetical protein
MMRAITHAEALKNAPLPNNDVLNVSRLTDRDAGRDRCDRRGGKMIDCVEVRRVQPGIVSVLH